MYSSHHTAYGRSAPRNAPSKTPIPAPTNNHMYLPPGILRTIHTPLYASPFAIAPTPGRINTTVTADVLQHFVQYSHHQIDEILTWFQDSGVTTLAEFTEFYNPYTIEAWINPSTRRPLGKFIIQHLNSLYHRYETQSRQLYAEQNFPPKPPCHDLLGHTPLPTHVEATPPTIHVAYLNHPPHPDQRGVSIFAISDTACPNPTSPPHSPSTPHCTCATGY